MKPKDTTFGAAIVPIVLYFFAVFVVGALFAPWLYNIVHRAAETLPQLREIADSPFHRYVSRSFLLMALAGLVPFVCAAGIRSTAILGLGNSPTKFRDCRRGFLLGFASMACAAVIAIAAGTRQLGAQPASAVIEHLFNAVLAAVAVALIEELFFRGVLFGALRQRLHWTVALAVSSAIYALLHFFQRPSDPTAIHWNSGIITLLEMLRGFSDVEQLVPGFFNLTLAGVILALAYHRTGFLYLSIGLHGGWIFWLKSYGFLTKEIESSSGWFWGSRKLIDGWLAFFVLSLTLLVILRRPAPGTSIQIEPSGPAPQ